MIKTHSRLFQEFVLPLSVLAGVSTWTRTDPELDPGSTGRRHPTGSRDQDQLRALPLSQWSITSRGNDPFPHRPKIFGNFNLSCYEAFKECHQKQFFLHLKAELNITQPTFFQLGYINVLHFFLMKRFILLDEVYFWAVRNTAGYLP